MKANAVNLATFANALCHLNPTPLSVAVLVPCAWGEKFSVWHCVAKHSEFSTATLQIQQSENGAVFGRAAFFLLLALFSTLYFINFNALFLSFLRSFYYF